GADHGPGHGHHYGTGGGAADRTGQGPRQGVQQGDGGHGHADGVCQAEHRQGGFLGPAFGCGDTDADYHRQGHYEPAQGGGCDGGALPVQGVQRAADVEDQGQAHHPWGHQGQCGGHPGGVVAGGEDHFGRGSHGHKHTGAQHRHGDHRTGGGLRHPRERLPAVAGGEFGELGEHGGG